MSKGRIDQICIAPSEGGEIQEVAEIEAIPGTGLSGDRYCKPNAAPETQITLIEAEAIDEFNQTFSLNLSATQFRRNVITRDVQLNSLEGKSFSVGEVKLRGIELCEPCAYLQNLLQIPGLVKQLTHKGGLRCEILSDGVIRSDDLITD